MVVFFLDVVLIELMCPWVVRYEHGLGLGGLLSLKVDDLGSDLGVNVICIMDGLDSIE